MIKRFRLSAEPIEPAANAARVALGKRLHGVAVTPSAPYEFVLIEWFRDGDDLGPAQADEVLAEEEVMRGDEWIAQRWLDGGPRLKHITLAQRAVGLTPTEFAAKWRSHAGTASGSPIPAEARGSAYVQNHPVLDAFHQWRYDAINEVYVEDEAALHARIDWFAENDVANSDRGLFGATWFMVVEETVLQRRST